MANIFDTAKYILENTKELERTKLQLLCFYSQAHSLAVQCEPIFREDFYASNKGPVVKELETRFAAKSLLRTADVKGSSQRLTFNNKLAVLDTLKKYESIGTQTLIKRACSEKPWLDAYNFGTDSVISKVEIGRFYRNAAEK